MGSNDARRLMLISNSFCHGRGYLEHCAEAIMQFLGPIRSLVFVPYAAKDWDKYTSLAREGFGRMGIEILGIHEPKQNPSRTLEQARAIFVGGGNTFRLIDSMLMRDSFYGVRLAVESGVPYLGASAGANVACPTIMTTNDMPIISPASMNALNLVPFQINPHYIDADPASTHMGETRERRIAEFHEENDTTVIGLREGAWITVEGGRAVLGGKGGAKLFVKGEEPREWGGTPLPIYRHHTVKRDSENRKTW